MNFGHIQTFIKNLNDQLSLVQYQDPIKHSLILEENIMACLNELLKREEILRRQKSRLQWLTTIDLNTNFFHMTSIMRKRRNGIQCLKD